MSALEDVVARVDAAAAEMAEALAELKAVSAQTDVTADEQRAVFAAHNRARRSVA